MLQEKNQEHQYQTGVSEKVTNKKITWKTKVREMRFTGKSVS